MTRKKIAIVMAACGVVGALVGALLRPGVGSIDENTRIQGDPELAVAALNRLSTQGIYALSIAEVTPEKTRIATVGAPIDGAFEIGSVTKPMTGMLYADAVERGEVSPETTLGEIFDLEDAESSSISLAGLSQHRSGLPRLPMSLSTLLNSYRWLLFGQNPYDDSPDDVVEDLKSVSVGAEEPEYSNLGFATLGHALAEASGQPYPELVKTRLTDPLGLETFYVPPPEEDGAHPQTVQGREASGRAQAAWDDSGYAPAGGIRADAASMGRLAEAMLQGSAPGAEALDPESAFDDADQIGAGWIASETQGQTITWHNGQTGGFSTWIGLDRERGTAVFISAATSHSVDEAGLGLLLQAGREKG